jgi:hypothetical protein
MVELTVDVISIRLEDERAGREVSCCVTDVLTYQHFCRQYATASWTDVTRNGRPHCAASVPIACVPHCTVKHMSGGFLGLEGQAYVLETPPRT